MENYYNTLGLNSSATENEIRRAYRILARRYHPDVNPGKDSSNRFKEIAEAYRILSDQKRREKYDIEFEQAEQKFQQARYRAYTEQARKKFQEQSRAYANKKRADEKREQDKPKTPPSTPQARKRDPIDILRTAAKNFIYKPIPNPFTKRTANLKHPSPGSVSIIEVSITVEDSILGVRKSIELSDGSSARKISVRIPPGAYTGSVVRMRNTENASEELVLVVRVARHPFLSIEKKGLIVDLPVTIHEATCGANIIVPSLDDQIVLKVPAQTQSGTYIRLQGRGITLKDKSRGDLFYRVIVRVPDSGPADTLKSITGELNEYYSGNIRSNLPKSIPS